MRRLILVAIGAIGLSLLSIPSFAQEVNYPKVEVFGGFSIERAGASFMGWQASITGTLPITSASWPISVGNTRPLSASP